jgi:hypothetical protein
MAKSLSLPLIPVLIISAVPFVVAYAKPEKFRTRCERLSHGKDPPVLEWFDTIEAQPKGLLLVWLGTVGDEEDISAGRLARAACLQGLDAVLIPPSENESLIVENRLRKYNRSENIYYAGIGPGAACALDKAMVSFQKNEDIKGLALACPEGRSPLFPKTEIHNIGIPVVFLNENDNSNLEYEFLDILKSFKSTISPRISVISMEETLVSSLLSFRARL